MTTAEEDRVEDVAVEDVDADPLLAAHGLLFLLAGRAPDDLISQGRAWLAEGRRGDLVRAVMHAVLTQDIALPRECLDLLAALLATEDEDPNVLGQVRVTESDPAPYFRFHPAGPDAKDAGALDKLDRAAVRVVKKIEGARGVWRVWRSPFDGSPWPPPKRLFLMEVDRDGGLPSLTGQVQDALGAAGERDPQVEVFPTWAQLPTYHRLAMANGKLIWATTAEPEITVASVFDEVDEETGPRFHADHARLDDEDEVRRMVEYLDAGALLLVTTARMDDLLDPNRTAAVPINFRTDGTWIWTDATTYYLREHGLAPDPELRAHASAVGYRVSELGWVAIHRALAVLQEPADEEPVWTDRPNAAHATESAAS